MENSKVFAMKFSKIYPLLIQKVEKKGRTKQEVDEVICWLTGYDADGIKGAVCGIRVEEIMDPLMQKIRYLDKLVDELAKGRAMEKILR